MQTVANIMRRYLKDGQYSLDDNDLLGKGTFGRVHRAYDHTNNQWRAIKVIDLELLQHHGQEMKTIICRYRVRQARKSQSCASTLNN